MIANVRIYLDDKLIRVECLPLDAIVITNLLGFEISKDARYPTELRVEIEKVEGE